MGLEKQMEDIAKKARVAALGLNNITTEKKNSALNEMADLLLARKVEIQEANQKDLEQARRNGLSLAMIDRLTLDEKRLANMAAGLRTVAGLSDPVGEELRSVDRPNGLTIKKVRVPIGVICIIYESRPNVTVDSAGLCFKSGNSVILRGGKEAINSNLILAKILQDALLKSGLSRYCIQIIDTIDRKAITSLLKLSSCIDLVIPRGGEALIRKVVAESQIPVIKHYKGICHVYVDKDADLKMAEEISINAKIQRPGVCNAMETLLVHQAVADEFVPIIYKALHNHKVEIRGCLLAQKIVPAIMPAQEEDWDTEYLDLILSIKVVADLDEAIGFINQHGSNHSDAIVSNNPQAAQEFALQVDSACVFVNSSTRFSDGGQFGMGAEIGISTDKIHARGPMGLEELTSYKYIVIGNGQIRK